MLFSDHLWRHSIDSIQAGVRVTSGFCFLFQAARTFLFQEGAVLLTVRTCMARDVNRTFQRVVMFREH